MLYRKDCHGGRAHAHSTQHTDFYLVSIMDDKFESERLRGRVEYWKQIASIQIHFNDMCIRTRWLGLTAIATLVAAAAIAEKENIRFSLPCEWSIGLPSILMLISLTLQREMPDLISVRGRSGWKDPETGLPRVLRRRRLAPVPQSDNRFQPGHVRGEARGE